MKEFNIKLPLRDSTYDFRIPVMSVTEDLVSG